ncbi:cytochrome P450 4C1-like [Anticarsia gemmatalis]|uniref:cytochrome P450 4C1-like n=1 Tax=Anticarsia gemmatalis TaxID=129554 RepID=UPI003F75F6FD
MLLIYLVVTILFLCLLEYVLNYNEKALLMKKIPGPKNHFILGNALAIMVSPVEIMKAGRRFAKTWKEGIYRFWMCPMAAVNIFNPEDIETITSTIKHNEKSALYVLLSPWLGEGLLLSKGTKWQERRKILTPTFHFNILRQFFEVMEENSYQLVESLGKTAGETIDIVPYITECTLQTICETAMGTKLNDKTTQGAKPYKQAMKDLVQVMYQRATKIPLYSDFIFYLSPLGRKQSKLLKIVHDFTGRVIQDRTEYIQKYGINYGDDTANNDDDIYVYREKKKKIAMLDLLITAADDGLIDKQGIQEEVDTFMFEGHDTTAAGLTFCLMLLANHKEVQDKIFAELNEIFGDYKGPIKVEDLNKMKYLECCIKESLRLYPPVHFISRNLKEPVVLSNYEVPAGVFCHIHIFDLHRREDIYPNPLEFKPERFFPENSKGRHPYAYLPFSAGPRNCIGQKFALMELKCVVAAVLRQFELIPVTRPSDVEFVADLVLRNNGPVQLKCVKRSVNK